MVTILNSVANVSTWFVFRYLVTIATLQKKKTVIDKSFTTARLCDFDSKSLILASLLCNKSTQ